MPSSRITTKAALPAVGAESVASREIFVDSSAWYPLLVRRHPDHARLAAALRSLVEHGQRVVTTNLVVAETHALTLSRGHGAAAIEFVRSVRQSPNLIVTSTEELERQAVDDWLEKFDDHDFSLTDAVSFAVMRQRGISGALTLDSHFRVAGFETVPRMR